MGLKPCKQTGAVKARSYFIDYGRHLNHLPFRAAVWGDDTECFLKGSQCLHFFCHVLRLQKGTVSLSFGQILGQMILTVRDHREIHFRKLFLKCGQPQRQSGYRQRMSRSDPKCFAVPDLGRCSVDPVKDIF